MPVIKRLYRGAGDREAEPIEDSIISTRGMTIARGKSFIDKNYYDTQGYSWKCPHKSNDVQQYKYVPVSGERIDLSSALMKITDYKIGWKNHQGMSAQIGLEYYKDSPFTTCAWNDYFTIMDSEKWTFYTSGTASIINNKLNIPGHESYSVLVLKTPVNGDFSVKFSYEFADLSGWDYVGFTYSDTAETNYLEFSHTIIEEGEYSCEIESNDISESVISSIRSGIIKIKVSGDNVYFYINDRLFLSGAVADRSFYDTIEIWYWANNDGNLKIDNFEFLSGCPEAT